MITEINYIPVTKDSYPFQAAARRCCFSEIGYVEDEYLMSGTANVYTEMNADHEVEVQIPDVPYTTRFLVRRPSDTKKFSGNVVIEILNSTAMLDIDRIWVDTWKYLTRNGDIYIGITSKGHVVDALKRFDAERYEKINWNNPDKSRKKPAYEVLPFLEEYESGLYWDMQNDLARLLRTQDEKNPIREYGNAYLYLAGWSQSTTYIARTIRSFTDCNNFPKNRNLFDGYYSAGGDASLAPINAYEEQPVGSRIFEAGARPSRNVLMCSKPLIEINTDSETRGAAWSEDHDEPDYKFRSYQIAGTSHDSWYNMTDYYDKQLYEDAKRAGTPLEFEGCEGEPLNTPYEYIFQAALRNLYLWVREEIPAPHAPHVEMVRIDENTFDTGMHVSLYGKVKYEYKKDVFGNTLGGIRCGNVDYPLGHYESYAKKTDGSLQEMFGTFYAFSPELLHSLYGSLEHYHELIERNAEELIATGFLLRTDKADYINTILNTAKTHGLQ